VNPEPKAPAASDDINCQRCNGEGELDDRGFAFTGQPYLFAKPCEDCGGSGVAKDKPKAAPNALADVWIIYRRRARGPSIDVAETAEMAESLCNKALGDYAVRYVKAPRDAIQASSEDAEPCAKGCEGECGACQRRNQRGEKMRRFPLGRVQSEAEQ
jgi:hypothetical protein